MNGVETAVVNTFSRRRHRSLHPKQEGQLQRGGQFSYPLEQTLREMKILLETTEPRVLQSPTPAQNTVHHRRRHVRCRRRRHNQGAGAMWIRARRSAETSDAEAIAADAAAPMPIVAPARVDSVGAGARGRHGRF